MVFYPYNPLRAFENGSDPDDDSLHLAAVMYDRATVAWLRTEPGREESRVQLAKLIVMPRA